MLHKNFFWGGGDKHLGFGLQSYQAYSFTIPIFIL